MLLGFGADGHAFAGEYRGHPLRRPGPFGSIIECRERLQRDRLERVLGKRAAEVVPVATHGKGRGPDRAAEIEGEHLGPGIAAELQRHQRQQHALAGAGRSDHEGMPDVTDMQGEPERGRAFGPGKEEQGGAPRCSSRSGPAHTAESGIMWARLRVETGGWRTLA